MRDSLQEMTTLLIVVGPALGTFQNFSPPCPTRTDYSGMHITVMVTQNGNTKGRSLNAALVFLQAPTSDDAIRRTEDALFPCPQFSPRLLAMLFFRYFYHEVSTLTIKQCQ